MAREKVLKSENIEMLKSALPDIFDMKNVKLDWDEDFHVIDKYDNYPNPFDESEIFPRSRESEIDENLRVKDIEQRIGIDRDSIILPESLEDDMTRDSVEKVKDIFETDFPGAPGGNTSRTYGKTAATDVYGFYLPWHHFDIDTWGIYVFAEGIIALGQQLHSFGNRILSPQECNLIARAFIYHHEAYHNKIETLSSKFEVVNRKKFYITSAKKLYKSNSQYHEEALANAYAFNKCCRLFEGYPHHQKEKLRMATRCVLANFIKHSPPKYKDAKDLIPIAWKTFCEAKNKFDGEEGIFTEKILQNKLKLKTPNKAELWATQRHLMDPTLRRNAPYSYLINKKSKLAKRLKLSVHYLKRRTFLTALQDHYPEGKLITQKGTKHPEKFVLGQMKIPVPSDGKKEINKYTAEGILKQLDIKMKVSDFIKGTS